MKNIDIVRMYGQLTGPPTHYPVGFPCCAFSLMVDGVGVLEFAAMGEAVHALRDACLFDWIELEAVRIEPPVRAPQGVHIVKQVLRIAHIERRKRLMIKAYVCCPYESDGGENTEKLLAICRFIIDRSFAPLVPQLIYPMCLEPGNAANGTFLTEYKKEHIIFAKEVWVFGDLTDAMREEITFASASGRQVHFMQRHFDLWCHGEEEHF